MKSVALLPLLLLPSLLPPGFAQAVAPRARTSAAKPDLSKLDAASTFTDNANNVVVVQAGEGTVTDDALWHAIAVPYRFEVAPQVSAKLTIEAGAKLQFRAGIELIVNQNGSPTAIGSAAQPIVFTGVEEATNYWYGVMFNSKSPSNVLRNV